MSSSNHWGRKRKTWRLYTSYRSGLFQRFFFPISLCLLLPLILPIFHLPTPAPVPVLFSSLSLVQACSRPPLFLSTPDMVYFFLLSPASSLPLPSPYQHINMPCIYAFSLPENLWNKWLSYRLKAIAKSWTSFWKAFDNGEGILMGLISDTELEEDVLSSGIIFKAIQQSQKKDVVKIVLRISL